MFIKGKQYCFEYLQQINTVLHNRMDGNNGKKDGKISINEAYKDLNIKELLNGLKINSAEYNKLSRMTRLLPQILKNYAGNDGNFQAKEWANFLNGKEWDTIINTYHTSSNFAKIEMKWIDNARGMKADGLVTKGEIKAGLIQNMHDINPDYDMSIIESIIDKYAGKDGTFTVKEYIDLKKNLTYSAFLKQYNVVPFYDRNTMA